jgi:hypothetical protein
VLQVAVQSSTPVIRIASYRLEDVENYDILNLCVTLGVLQTTYPRTNLEQVVNLGPADRIA